MKNFTVYETATGLILRTGICQDETFDGQAMNAGQAVIEGFGDWSTQYLVNGAFVARPASTVSCSQTGGMITLTGVRAGIQPQIMDSTGATRWLDPTGDGSAIMAILSAGTYAVTVNQFPELPFSQQVTIS